MIYDIDGTHLRALHDFHETVHVWTANMDLQKLSPSRKQSFVIGLRSLVEDVLYDVFVDESGTCHYDCTQSVVRRMS